MSAYIVSKKHIDALIRSGLEGEYERRTSYYYNGRTHRLDSMNADAIGRMLWLENLASVACRYPDCGDGERPAPVGLTDADIAGYTYPVLSSVPVPSAVETLKLLDCYEYQSCEHPGWEQSEAHALANAIRKEAIYRLPGYDEAPWRVE